MSLGQSSTGRLGGTIILVLEDEYFVASQISEALRAAGARVLGPFPKPDLAMSALSSEQVNCAVLDINLAGQLQFGLADRLQAAGTPFVFSSGYDETVVPERHRNAPYCLKPWNSDDLVEKIEVELGLR